MINTKAIQINFIKKKLIHLSNKKLTTVELTILANELEKSILVKSNISNNEIDAIQ